MKRAVVLLLLAVLLLSGCAKAEQPRYIEDAELGLTVDTQQQTITDGTYTYHYTVSDTQITVTYPNGATYYRNFHEYSEGASYVTENWSEDYDDVTYRDAWDLLSVIPEEELGTQSGTQMDVTAILAGVGMIAVGILCVGSPYTVWYGEHGWKYKDAEPSELALSMATIGGVILLIAGIAAFIMGLIGL